MECFTVDAACVFDDRDIIRVYKAGYGDHHRKFLFFARTTLGLGTFWTTIEVGLEWPDPFKEPQVCDSPKIQMEPHGATWSHMSRDESGGFLSTDKKPLRGD